MEPLRIDAIGSAPLDALSSPQPPASPAESSSVVGPLAFPALLEPLSPVAVVTPADQALTNENADQDLALDAALRFGAGVAPSASPAATTPKLGSGLVRDATAVAGQDNLQPHQGSPGPEAFAHPKTTNRMPIRPDRADPEAKGSTHVDLSA